MFLSLRTKAAIFSALLPLALVCIILLIAYQLYSILVEKSVDRLSRTQKAAITTLIDTNVSKIEQLSTYLASNPKQWRNDVDSLFDMAETGIDATFVTIAENKDGKWSQKTKGDVPFGAIDPAFISGYGMFTTFSNVYCITKQCYLVTVVSQENKYLVVGVPFFTLLKGLVNFSKFPLAVILKTNSCGGDDCTEAGLIVAAVDKLNILKIVDSSGIVNIAKIKYIVNKSVLFKKANGIDNDGLYLISAVDVTKDFDEMLDSLYLLLLYGSVIVIISTVIAYLANRSVTLNLMSVAEQLPQVVNKGYKPKVNKLPTIFKDETNFLVDHMLDLHRIFEGSRAKLEEYWNEIIRNKDYLQMIVNNIPAFVIVSDSRKNIEQINSFACNVFSCDENCSDQTCISIGRPTKQLFDSPVLKDKHIEWRHKKYRGKVVSIGIDITERVEREKQIEWEADHDQLTKLYNRSYLRRHLNDLITKKSGREEDRGYILLLDVDGFKLVNDINGHNAGDALLSDIADTLRSSVREGDLVARVGGDEFIIVFHNLVKDDLHQVIDKLKKSLSVVTYSLKSRILTLRVSTGAVDYYHNCCSIDDLVSYADLAMYESKENKRFFTLYNPKMSHIVQADRARWRDTIQFALSTESFILYAQKICSVDNGEPVKFEVLLRLAGSDNIIGPNYFIPHAEHYKMMFDLDMYVVNHVFNFLQYEDAYQLSINLSNQTLQHPKFLEAIEELRNKYNINTGNVTFEVTETISISDMGYVKNILDKLCSEGYSIALDDYGVGWAGLSMLHALPISILKIDKSFVDSIGRNKRSYNLINATVHMCQVLGIDVIAEGAEDRDTITTLKEMGINYTQGYADYGEPIPLLYVRDNYEAI